VGICGGYQMLGRSIRDPEGVESPQPEISGLGLIPVDTLFERVKATHQAEARILGGPGWLATLQGETIRGYEIHMGRTPSQRPWLEITRRSDTPASLADLHGLFANAALRRAWLASLGWYGPAEPTQPAAGLQSALDILASQVAASLDMRQLEAIIWGS
jgi:adenosylcobyric acid synthase